MQKMLEKKVESKPKNEQKARDDGIELENQFILRLPEEVAKSLREAMASGNLKDRMTIRMDSDLRYGEVYYDHWHLHAKVVDLPTIMECLKTIDNKSFYKTADICQMMICKEEADALDTDKESPVKGKKKDPNKVDKKFLWPHGITPPCKNVRKRRFRKTLKKKNVEAPEIEKEVKRLLRIDNDAVRVEYEIINEDETDKRTLDEQFMKEYQEGDEDYNESGINDGKSNDSPQKDINIESDGDDDDTSPRKEISGASSKNGSGQAQISNVGEHDIFGGELSSSTDNDDDFGLDRNEASQMRDLEDMSRLSADDSRLSDDSDIGVSSRMSGIDRTHTDTAGVSNSKDGFTSEFNKSMFTSHKSDTDDMGLLSKMEDSSSNIATTTSSYFEERKSISYMETDDDASFSHDASNPPQPQLGQKELKHKIGDLRRQCSELKFQESQKAIEIAAIQNPTLRQRMHDTLNSLQVAIGKKELEIVDHQNMLKFYDN